MTDKCAGCFNKYKFREKPTACAKCRRDFCSMCIPQGKSKKQKIPAVRDTCIYCTRQLQEAMKEQQTMAMEKFSDRFYNSPHLQPALHTKLRLNEDTTGGGGEGGGGHSESLLSEEDRKLEERLRKLKESHKPTKPADSEEVLKERLAKLRNENVQSGTASEGDPSSEGLPPSSSTTQADDLVKQVSDRVKLDASKDESRQHNVKLDDSITTFLSGLEVQLDNEDPNELLEDLNKFQSKQERLAMAEATSNDVQAVVEKARELQKHEQDELGEGQIENIITPYPQLPDNIRNEQGQEEDVVSEAEISKVLEAARKEMEQEERAQKDLDQFVVDASKRLDGLRGKDNSEADSDCEVRSKLGPGGDLKHTLDFSWSHFGGPGTALNLEQASDSRQGVTAARQLGITLSDEVLDSKGMDTGDDVAGLIERAMAEVALDRKLEERGLDRYLEPAKNPPSKSSGEKEGSIVASGSSGACAATNYLSSGWEADPDDLPWCCICNADAHIRCYDCDSDLYCTQCFSEGHEQFGLFDHKYAPFEPLSSRAV